MLSIVRKFREWLIIRRYVAIGLRWGGHFSEMLFSGPPAGFASLELKYIRLTRQYESLGYKPVPHIKFAEVGGGYLPKSALDSSLRVKK